MHEHGRVSAVDRRFPAVRVRAGDHGSVIGRVYWTAALALVGFDFFLFFLLLDFRARLISRFGIGVAGRLAASRATLLGRRSGRPQPARDDKVLAAWNGLAIGALADAARAMDAAGDPALAGDAARYRDAATVAAEAVPPGPVASSMPSTTTFH